MAKKQNRKSMITELYWDLSEKDEFFKPQNPEYDRVVAEQNKIAAHLKELLSKRQFELFEEYMDLQTELEIVRLEKTYRKGVSLGVQITAEAFLGEL